MVVSPPKTILTADRGCTITKIMYCTELYCCWAVELKERQSGDIVGLRVVPKGINSSSINVWTHVAYCVSCVISKPHEVTARHSGY